MLEKSGYVAVETSALELEQQLAPDGVAIGRVLTRQRKAELTEQDCGY